MKNLIVVIVLAVTGFTSVVPSTVFADNNGTQPSQREIATVSCINTMKMVSVVINARRNGISLSELNKTIESVITGEHSTFARFMTLHVVKSFYAADMDKLLTAEREIKDYRDAYLESCIARIVKK